MKTLSENPKVSIIMSVYNAKDTLGEAIDSIINQTYSNWEFVICDDCSTDSTMSILQDYKKRFPDKFVILNNQQNMRLSYSLNKCLNEATGELIARMDGDDKSLPKRLEKEVNYLKEHSDLDLVGTKMQRFNVDGLASIVECQEKPDKYSLRNGACFNHATIMTYKCVYDELEGYTVSERTKRSQDYDLWFRFYAHGFKGGNIQEVLYLVREDINAIKRRTINNRINILKTQIIGFRMLGYPKRWLIKPIFETMYKCLVPYKMVELYRNFQKRQYEKMRNRK